MKLNKEDYVARIANANGAQLTVITYEIAIAYMLQAMDAHKENGGEFKALVKKAQPAVESLVETLDMRYGIAKTLLLIYLYVNELLNEACEAGRAEPVAEAVKIMRSLLESWVEAEKAGSDDPALMENAQQIYAGLTYKNGSLIEYVKDDADRGFKA